MKTRILVAVLLSSALAATGAQAQFMFIEGLPGEVTRAGLEETHELALYAHAVQVPIDPASGQFTGVRLHSPIIVKKKFNLSSPLLYRASTNGEVLPSVEFRFYRTDNRGAEVEYFNVELENAYVVSFATQSTAQDDPFTRPEDTPVLEEITLTYRRITWTYVEGGITHTDDWAVPRKRDDLQPAASVERIVSSGATIVKVGAINPELVSVASLDGLPVAVERVPGGILAAIDRAGFYSYEQEEARGGHFFAR